MTGRPEVVADALVARAAIGRPSALVARRRADVRRPAAGAHVARRCSGSPGAGVALAVVRHGTSLAEALGRPSGEGRWLSRLSLRAVLAAAPPVAVVHRMPGRCSRRPSRRARSSSRLRSRSCRRSSPTGGGGSSAALVVGATALAVAFETWPHRGLARRVGRPPRRACRAGAVRPVGFPTLHGLVVVVGVRAWRSSRRSGAASGGRGSSSRRWPLGVGFPAVLLEDAHALSLGAARARRRRSGRRSCSGRRTSGAALVGVALAGALVVGLRRRRPAPGSRPAEARSTGAGGTRSPAAGPGNVRFLWDASYAGIDFPGPADGDAPDPRAARARSTGGCRRSRRSPTIAGSSTSIPVSPARPRRRLPPDALAPRARRAGPGSWLRQEVDGRRPRRQPRPRRDRAGAHRRAGRSGASSSCRAA